MRENLLKSLSMVKHERMLPRVFQGAARLEIHDRQERLFWSWPAKPASETQGAEDNPDDAVAVAWSDYGASIERRTMPGGQLQFRSALKSRQYGTIAWLIATYDTRSSVSLESALDPLRRAFTDAKMFLQEEIELQSECNELAAELGERYEELNLVYSTKDHVEYFEEGQEALARLVHNCADYLDVGLAALICRERGLTLHNTNGTEALPDIEQVMTLLATTVYDRVESQVQSIVLNDGADADRARVFGGRSENVLAYPIVDDHGTTIGLIAVVARRNKQIFSNGDRNLLEVMAKKASRIIHTHHDSLTGLMNRSGFESALVASVASTQSKNLQHCLLHINVDQLHVINDLMGYQEGDALIRRIAKTLRGVLRDSDVMSRLGGGEFGVLLPSCEIGQGQAVAEKLRDGIGSLTVVSAKRTLNVSACIGIAQVTRDVEGIVAVMASAEIACKAAKEGGRDRIEVFEKDNTQLVARSEEVEWVGRVQEALREDLFVLYCQPVLPLLDQSIPAHYEILIRLRDKDGTILTPNFFLPAAERYQLMPLIDRWVVHNTLKSLGSCWKTIGIGEPVICINLSGQSFANVGFQAFIIDELEQFNIPPKNICFEVTETSAISHIEDAIIFMQSLKNIGCRFSLDDFGAGLSSFGYLKVLPVDYLKIDGSFVREITTDKVSWSMVDAICQIGRTMKLSMVAEYVGDEETKEALRLIGVDYVQGFGIGKPIPLTETLECLLDKASAESA